MVIAALDPYSQNDPSTGLAAGALIGVVVLYAAMLAFGIYCYVRIARKAGYSGWYAALLFVPVANLVVMLMFVFKEWPIETELRMLRSGGGGHGGYPQAHPGFSSPAAAYPSRFPASEASPYGGPGQSWGQAPQQPGYYPPADPGPQAPGSPWTGPQG